MSNKHSIYTEVYAAHADTGAVSYAVGKFREYLLDPNKPEAPVDIILVGHNQDALDHYFGDFAAPLVKELGGGGKVRFALLLDEAPALDLVNDLDVRPAVYQPKAPPMRVVTFHRNNGSPSSYTIASNASWADALDVFLKHQGGYLVSGDRVTASATYPSHVYHHKGMVTFDVKGPGVGVLSNRLLAKDREDLKTKLPAGRYLVAETHAPDKKWEDLIAPAPKNFKVWYDGDYGAPSRSAYTAEAPKTFAEAEAALYAEGIKPNAYSNSKGETIRVRRESDQQQQPDLRKTAKKRFKVWFDGANGDPDKSKFVEAETAAEAREKGRGLLTDAGFHPIYSDVVHAQPE